MYVIYMSYLCHLVVLVKNLRNFILEYLKIRLKSSKIDPQTLLKKWSTDVIQVLTHKHYAKSDPQTLLKYWPTNVTQKVIHKRYSKNWPTNVTQKVIHSVTQKSDPQTLLKNWPTEVTQKVIHKRYSKIGPQKLLKKWPTNGTNLFNPRKHDSALKIQMDSALKIQKGYTRKFFQPISCY